MKKNASNKFVRIFFNIDTIGGTAFLFIVMYLLFLLPISLDFFDPLESAFNDFELTDIVFSQFRSDEEITIDTNIVLVNIDNLSDRGDIEKIINIISNNKPKVIGIDILFKEQRDSVLDFNLAETFSKYNNIVLVNKLVDNDNDSVIDSVNNSIPMFSDYTYNAYADLVSNEERGFRTIREFLTRYSYNDTTYLSFATQIVKLYDINKYSYLIKRDNDFETINFIGNYNSFLRFSANEAISDDSLDLSYIKDKIVLIGFLDVNSKCENESLEDYFFTPLNERYAGRTFPDMRGLVIHANIISQILNQRYINQLGYYANIILQILIVFINIVLFAYLNIKLKYMYDVYTKFIQLVESIILIIAQLYIFYSLEYKIAISLALLGIILSADIYEFYYSLYRKIFKKAAQ